MSRQADRHDRKRSRKRRDRNENGDRNRPPNPVRINPPPPSERHLLAIDMGLRTGIAIYGPNGRLRSYRSKHFGSISELRKGVPTIVRDAPPLGWIWLEGGGDIAEVWSKHAAHRGIDFRQIHAAAWRETLMLPRQQRSGDIAKKEADGLARRVIAWSGAPRPKGELRHDAAEAILLGLHGALQVNLLDRVPKV